MPGSNLEGNRETLRPSILASQFDQFLADIRANDESPLLAHGNGGAALATRTV